MPTKRRRVRVVPDNLPSQIDDDCPGVYTAAKLFKDRPEVYAAIVQGLVEGMAITPMKHKFKVSHNTIGVIRQREKEVIDQSRSVLKGLTGVAAQATLEKYLERLDQNKIPDGVLPCRLTIGPATGVAKWALCEGARLLAGFQPPDFASFATTLRGRGRKAKPIGILCFAKSRDGGAVPKGHRPPLSSWYLHTGVAPCRLAIGPATGPHARSAPVNRLTGIGW